jgi:hypothetical protein
MEFPIYRKYKNNKHFFKIISIDEFEELSFIGKKLIITLHQVTILPDRNFVSDLLHDIGNTAEIATEEEYQQILTLN